MFSDTSRIREDLERLSSFTATPEKGVTRLSYTSEYKAAAAYLRARMEEASLSVREEAAGVLVGRYEGENPSAPVTLVGSHLDSVQNGGRFDGAAGLAAALEAARQLKSQGFLPKAPIDFVAFPETTGSRFGAANLGSRAFCGALTPEEAEQIQDASGKTLNAVLKEYGSSCCLSETAPSLARYLELHIEQGPLLEHTVCQLGIGEAISGVDVYRITIHGRSDHAGTTPMEHRADSFLLAARAAVAVNDAVIGLADGTAATVGQVQVSPGSYNIIPGETVFTVDVRGKSDKSRMKIHRVLQHFLDGACREEPGFSYEIAGMVHYPAVQMDKEMRKLLTALARKNGYSARPISSGAFHDAVVVAQLCPAAMIYVPSQGGRSHCPEEFTSYEDIARGTDLLCQALMELA